MKLRASIRRFVLPLGLLLFIIAALVFTSEKDVKQTALAIQEVVQQVELQLQDKNTQLTIVQTVTDKPEQWTKTSYYKEHNLHAFLYQRDTLYRWTDYKAVPSLELADDITRTSLVRLKNGWFLIIPLAKQTRIKAIVTRPVKLQFPFENRLLENRFVLNTEVPAGVELSEVPIQGGIPIISADGRPLFYLYKAADVKISSINPLRVATMVIVLLLTIYAMLYVFTIGSAVMPRISSLLLLLGFVVLRVCMLTLHWPNELYTLPLFQPDLYASSYANPSLGDLILNVVLLLLATKYALPKLLLKHTADKPAPRWYVMFLLAGHVVVSFLIMWLLKTLILDSTISFEIYRVFSLDAYSIAGFVILFICIYIHYVYSVWVKGVLSSHHSYALLIPPVVALFIAMLLGYFTAVFESVLFTAIWILAFYMWFYTQHKMSVFKTATIRTFTVYLLLYCVLLTFLIENLHERKERNQRLFLAGKLVTERDYVAEYAFQDVADRIASDILVKNYYANPIIPLKQVTDRISSLYLSGYFNRYDVSLSALNSSKQILYGDDSLQTSMISVNASQGKNEYRSLAYVPDSSRNYQYTSLIDVYQDTVLIGYLQLTLVPKTYYGHNVYPELLLGSKVIYNLNTYNYFYAIYQNDKLVAQYGEYPYTYYWNTDYQFNGANYAFIEEKNWEHNIHRYENGKKVVVTVEREPAFEPFATFSYLFILFILLSVLMVIIQSVTSVQWPFVPVLQPLSFTFRLRINTLMLSLMITSFLIIGFVTIRYFTQQYHAYYNERMVRKEKVIHSGIENALQQYVMPNSGGISSSTLSIMNFELARQADVNAVDVNLYDAKGRLLLSSQPAMYEKGLISKLMNPAAYFRLHNQNEVQVIAQENIGNLSYASVYSPVRNTDGTTLAYLGIPYFERSKEIDSEISSFLAALINVYVFLFVCALLLSYIISDSITKPLTYISERLRLININQKNEPIVWESKDEIGELVAQYNKMIFELEASASKLAKSERESAWREMAKQIAHEIKNPLTPMKLSIQYLQRAIDEGHPNSALLAKSVTKTLSEQIENLSEIATAFSSFAKMPTPVSERVDLRELLVSVVTLFRQEQDTIFNLDIPTGELWVLADKNQLISVFNNLIKNALQSIPESREGEINIQVEELNGWFTITIRDNGIGIPESFRERVFEPNFTTKSSGTGLGLAIVKQIVNGNGGKVWFETQEGIGTTFYIQLQKLI